MTKVDSSDSIIFERHRNVSKWWQKCDLFGYLRTFKCKHINRWFDCSHYEIGYLFVDYCKHRRKQCVWETMIITTNSIIKWFDKSRNHLLFIVDCQSNLPHSTATTAAQIAFCVNEMENREYLLLFRSIHTYSCWF